MVTRIGITFNIPVARWHGVHQEGVPLVYHDGVYRRTV